MQRFNWIGKPQDLVSLKQKLHRHDHHEIKNSRMLLLARVHVTLLKSAFFYNFQPPLVKGKLCI